MISLLIFASLVCLVSAGLVSAQIRAHALTRCTWDDLILRMQPVSLEGVKIVALDPAVSQEIQLQLSPEEMWNALGGLAGLQRMQQNAKLMIALASYAERSNNHERMIIAERMRRDGLIVNQAVRAIRITRTLHNGAESLPLHLRELADSYQQMKQRLPALYEMSRAGLSPA